MPRSKRDWLSPRVLLAVTTAAVLLLALLPPRWTRWTRGPQRPVLVVVGPGQDLIGRVARRVRPDRRPERLLGETERALRQEIAELKTELLQARDLVESLMRENAELRLGRSMDPGLEVALLPAVPVIGPGADLAGGLIRIRAGSEAGVTENAVAVTQGVHLVGRIAGIGPSISEVLPVTARAAKDVDGVVMLSESIDTLQVGPRVQLVAQGNGRLEGIVEDTFNPQTGATTPITRGMRVRLVDDRWPRVARQLIIGRITEVTSRPDQPLRTVIVVEPEVDITSLSEVTLRMPPPPPGAERSGGR